MLNEPGQVSPGSRVFSHLHFHSIKQWPPRPTWLRSVDIEFFWPARRKDETKPSTCGRCPSRYLGESKLGEYQPRNAREIFKAPGQWFISRCFPILGNSSGDLPISVRHREGNSFTSTERLAACTFVPIVQLSRT